MEKSIIAGQTVLYYYQAGSGNEPLLLFHGFGQDHRSFEPLVTSLAGKYTFYLFDLFFHGKSTWGYDEEPLEKEQWRDIIADFLHDNQLERFSLGGFSLGGKFVFATLEFFAGRTNKIFLMGPDGIHTSPWYNLATYPFPLRKFFKSMITHPGNFEFLIKLFTRLGISDKSLLRFAESQMNTEEKRRRVYYAWVVFRHLHFNLKETALLIDSLPCRARIIVGKYDNVIKAANMRALLKWSRNTEMTVLDTGHNGILKHALLPDLLDTDCQSTT